MPIPENAQQIWDFLIKAGFNENAAAGILGNIEQESSGNPGAPNGGLIQILPGNPGYTSSSTLAAQMGSIIAYVKANGSISDINSHASSPQAAALYFSTSYERPLASAANNPNREDSAAAVFAAAQSGKWPTSGSDSGTPNATATGAGLFSWPGDITGFFGDSKTLVDSLLWLVNPASWMRIGSFAVGTILVLLAVYVFTQVNSGESLGAPLERLLGSAAGMAMSIK
jgi:hypothetical protein